MLPRSRVSPRDLEALLRTLPGLYALHDPNTHLRRSRRAIASLIPSDHAMWAVFAGRNGGLGPPTWITAGPRAAADLRRSIETALIARFSSGPDSLAGRQSSDGSTRSRPDAPAARGQSPLVFGRGLILGLGPLLIDRNHTLILGLGRKGRAFTARDRQLLGLLAPHLVQAYQQALRLPRPPSKARMPNTARMPIILPMVPGLTPRESEVARWIADGKTNREIGLILGVAARTVEKHVERIFRKMRVRDRVTAMLNFERLRVDEPVR